MSSLVPRIDGLVQVLHPFCQALQHLVDVFYARIVLVALSSTLRLGTLQFGTFATGRRIGIRPHSLPIARLFIHSLSAQQSAIWLRHLSILFTDQRILSAACV